MIFRYFILKIVYITSCFKQIDYRKSSFLLKEYQVIFGF